MAKYINVTDKPLVFVQHGTGDNFTVYQDGKEVRGIRSIYINAGEGEFTTHEIEYTTGATAEEKAVEPKITYEIPAEGLRILRPTKSANERRAEVIEKAKKFVEEITAINGDMHPDYVTNPEIIVNEEKRTVVALIRGSISGKARLKGIAKCAPSDVFNVHIGKAIALGRAYGLDVSEFVQAPQPDEVVPGMVVRGGQPGKFYSPDKRFTITKNSGDGSLKYLENPGDWIEPEQVGAIISDSEAQY